jgi:uncharacterized protein (TIRG00374 family)
MVVYFGWPEVTRAWGLLSSVNGWILSLLIPVQLLSYYAVGNIIFLYLRNKGNIRDISHWSMARMALELNFVNHILPSGGAAGFSYLGWVLSRHGVSAGRAAMAQIIRFALMFLSFIGLLLVAVLALILDNNVNRVTILTCVVLSLLVIGGALFVIYIIGSATRLKKFSKWLSHAADWLVSLVTFGKKKNVINHQKIEEFFNELHVDYVEIRNDKSILKKPLIWAIIANVADVLLLSIAFWSLGFWVSPATLLIAFGVSGLSSFISVTPGGAGVYEAIMIAFLASAGVPPDIAIAGTLLARVALLSGTIIFGYIFYQLTILKYGKNTA